MSLLEDPNKILWRLGYDVTLHKPVFEDDDACLLA